MSHYSLIKIKIKNPNEQLLLQSLKEIANEIGAEIVSEIEDYYGNKRTDFLIAIKNNTYHRGVGIKLENGEVKLIGDFFGYRDKIKDLQMLIIQHYTKNALISSLKSLGYQTNVQKVKKKIYVKAVSWL